MESTLIFILIIASAFILAAIGTYFSSSQDAPSYHMENLEISLLQTVCGIFSVVGGGELIAVSTLSYSYGTWSAILFVGFALGAVFFIPFVDTIRRYNNQSDRDIRCDIYSIPDFIYLYGGKYASFITTLYAVLALSALLLIQLSLGGEMIHLLTGLPSWCFVVLISLTSGYYVYRGGFRGILMTDIIQIIGLFVVFSLLSYGIDLSTFPLSLEAHSSRFPDIATLLILIIGGISWVLGGPDIWQRVLASHSSQTAKNALLINAILLLLFGLILAILGTKIAYLLPEASPELSFFIMLESLPFHLKCIAAIGLIAALFSTTDTELHAISTIINKEMSRERQQGIKTKDTKRLVITLSFLSAFLSILLSEYLLDLYYILLNLFMVMGASLLPLFFCNKKTPQHLISSQGILNLLISLGLLGGGVVLLFLVIKDLHLEGAYSLSVTILPFICSVVYLKKSQC